MNTSDIPLIGVDKTNREGHVSILSSIVEASNREINECVALVSKKHVPKNERQVSYHPQ